MLLRILQRARPMSPPGQPATRGAAGSLARWHEFSFTRPQPVPPILARRRKQRENSMRILTLASLGLTVLALSAGVGNDARGGGLHRFRPLQRRDLRRHEEQRLRRRGEEPRGRRRPRRAGLLRRRRWPGETQLNVGGDFTHNQSWQIGSGGTGLSSGKGFAGGAYKGPGITAGNASKVYCKGCAPSYGFGDLPTGNANFNFGGLTSMTAVQGLFKDAASAWNGLPGATVGPSGNSIVFAKAAGSTFFVSAAALGSKSVYDWVFTGFGASDTVLINVTGDSFSKKHGGEMKLNGASAGKILFNFVDAKSVETENFSFQASVVAAMADVKGKNGHIEGQLFANGYENRGGHEFHSASFTGDLAVTPIPAALPFLASGLGVLGFVARRRKAA
jgi:choice-of-anchor A domain-containing protein